MAEVSVLTLSSLGNKNARATLAREIKHRSTEKKTTNLTILDDDVNQPQQPPPFPLSNAAYLRAASSSTYPSPSPKDTIVVRCSGFWYWAGSLGRRGGGGRARDSSWLTSDGCTNISPVSESIGPEGARLISSYESSSLVSYFVLIASDIPVLRASKQYSSVKAEQVDPSVRLSMYARLYE